jgi:hypothetical protein
MALQWTNWLDLNQLALGRRQATTINFRPADLELQAYVPMSDSRQNPAGSMLDIVYRDALWRIAWRRRAEARSIAG